ncbi:unnamed protein product, partial [Lymnaea stagnalis]
NVFNIIIFLKIGLKDSISVCFFAISGADLICVMFLISAECSLLLSKFMFQLWRVEGDTLSLLIMFYYGPVYDISQGITTFLAVQKCWCVASPFRFKKTFTKTRTAFAVAGICMVSVLLCVPIFASQGLQEAFDPVRNTTVFKLTTSRNRAQIMSARSTTSLVTTTTCQATVSACLVILASSLRASSKFRNATSHLCVETASFESTKTNGNAIPKETLKTHEIQRNSFSSDGRTINSPNESMASGRNRKISITRPRKNIHRKELCAIKSTTMVSVIFVVCTMPKLLFFSTILCEPGFSLFGRYENTYLTASTIRYTFEACSVSCNVFVYLGFNRRFRSSFEELLGRKVPN